jgi:nucleoside-triphosphatase THEP1
MSTDNTPVLAAIRYEQDLDINGMLRKVVTMLREMGIKVGGVLQEAVISPNTRDACLNIVDIRTGRSECITQNRGSGSRGCKLDPRGLAEISHCITSALSERVDLVVINKFGAAEAEGGGLLSSITEAISAGVPVLTAVREPYVNAWNSFHGGLASDLSPSVDTILQWCDRSRRRREDLSGVISVA